MTGVAMYKALDIFFFIFHSIFILFILIGWAWRKTRRAHFAAVFLTAISWCVLGIWFGFGYCPCTDWHWRVRMTLGDTALPSSYIKFLIDHATGLDANPVLVDAVTVAAFVCAFILSLWLNLRDRRTRNG